MDEETTRPEEMKCPLCDKAVRSDADADVLCALCGMPVYDGDEDAVRSIIDGRPTAFCCGHCEAMYMRIWRSRPTSSIT